MIRVTIRNGPNGISHMTFDDAEFKKLTRTRGDWGVLRWSHPHLKELESIPSKLYMRGCFYTCSLHLQDGDVYDVQESPTLVEAMIEDARSAKSLGISGTISWKNISDSILAETTSPLQREFLEAMFDNGYHETSMTTGNEVILPPPLNVEELKNALRS